MGSWIKPSRASNNCWRRRRSARKSICTPGTQEPIGRFEVATGPKRLLYLALAGGSFMMTLVGLVVPGIPTVPFLLATSYFLARSSRWLDEKLRESVFFGSIVTEWEQHRALGRQSKAKLMALSGAIVLVAIILSPLSPLGDHSLLLVSSLSVYGVYRLPGLEEGPRATVSRFGAAAGAAGSVTERPDRRTPRIVSEVPRQQFTTTSWPFVRTMVERDVVRSTNDVAAELVRDGARCTAAGGLGAPADARAGTWQPRVVVRRRQLDVHDGNRSGRARAGADA